MTEFSEYGYLPSLNGSESLPFKYLLETAVTPQMHGSFGVFDSGTDDTPHFLWALDTGKTVFIPPGTYKITAELLNTYSDQLIFGYGPSSKLYYTAGIAEASGVRVTGKNVRIRDFELVNVNELQSSIGGRNYAISVEDDGCEISKTISRQWQNGLAVRAEGTGDMNNKELVETKITFNDVLDIVGCGLENRGDAINCTGARALIEGNTVRAKIGTDARIGIHAEGLTLEHDGTVEYPDAMVRMIGNISTGPFRRNAVMEQIWRGVMIGNTLAGATDWNLAIILGGHVLAAHNTCLFDKTTAEFPDGWTTSRGSIIVRQGSIGHQVTGNNVTITGDAVFGMKGHSETGSIPVGTMFHGNSVTLEGDGTCDYGFMNGGTQGSIDTSVHDNYFDGAFTVATIFDNEGLDTSIRNNYINGRGSSVPGILLPDGAGLSVGAIVEGNVLKDVGAISNLGSGATIGTNYTRTTA